MAKTVQPPEWLELVKPIGAGGMGQVYEAIDKRKGERVALKTLARFEGLDLLRLKNEFRTFAEVLHPNLVTQHELLESHGQWFLVMELLDGVELLEHVRGEVTKDKTAPHLATPSTAPTTDDSTQPMLVQPIQVSGLEPPLASPVPAPMAPKPKPMAVAPDLFRLRHVMHGLALGIDAIHRSGNLHRDIKPSNVIVTSAGRPVVLDFGIAVAMESSRKLKGETDVVVGTPAYLAPELLENAPASPASDWYSFGVVLYELLSGERPFPGSPAEIFRRKLRGAPTPIDQVVPGLPEDLVTLTQRLLERDPKKRPGIEEILNALGDAKVVRALTFQHTHTGLVGRRRELQELHRIAQDALKAPRAIFLRGRSGVGKSALTDGLLHSLEEAGALVLAGRCYEQESVPYKAVDKLVDSLTNELTGWKRSALEALLPEDAQSLAGAFPVMRDLVGPELSRAGEAVVNEATDLQRRALEALAELLQRLALQVRLVCCIDDLQWGDTDSVRLYARLLRPGGPPLLVVGGFRAENDEAEPLVALRNAFVQETGAPPEVFDVKPLTAEDSAELAEQLAREAQVTDAGVIAWAQRESGGEPYFLHELMFFAAGETDFQSRSGLTLKDALLARIGRLSADARALLEVIALAGHGLPQGIADEAARVAQGRRARQELRNAHFVRTAGPSREDDIDTWHDKVREVVTAQASDDTKRRVHARLFFAWRARGSADVARQYALAFHGLRAGQELPAPEVFEVALQAARAAFDVFDTVKAQAYLLEAQSLAARSGLPFPFEHAMALGDASIALGDIEHAELALRDALSTASNAYERAVVRFGSSRVALSRLDTPRTLAQASEALVELGLTPLRRSPLGLLRAGFRALVTSWARRLGVGRTTPEPALAALVVRLYIFSAYAAYFLMRRTMFAEGVLRSYPSASQLRSGLEVTQWHFAGGVILSVLRRHGWARRLLARANVLARESRDPALKAQWTWFSAFAADVGGAPLEASRGYRESMKPQSVARLENSELFNLIASHAWNAVMRGDPDTAVDAVKVGLDRLAVSGNLVARGHTFRMYAGPALAMMGKGEEGAAVLDQFEAFVAKHSPDDIWRNTQLMSQRLLHLQLAGADEATFERCVQAHERLGVKPSDHPLQVRQYFIALGYRRLEGALRTRSEQARAEFKRALAQLRRTGPHATVDAHALVMDGVLAWLQGSHPLELWAQARQLAMREENRWVPLEADFHEACWRAEQGGSRRFGSPLSGLSCSSVGREDGVPGPPGRRAAGHGATLEGLSSPSRAEAKVRVARWC